jgi:hypothetical protein
MSDKMHLIFFMCYFFFSAFLKQMKVGGIDYNLQLVDTAGQVCVIVTSTTHHHHHHLLKSDPPTPHPPPLPPPQKKKEKKKRI